jgi:hypothetical protein
MFAALDALRTSIVRQLICAPTLLAPFPTSSNPAKTITLLAWEPHKRWPAAGRSFAAGA